MITAITDKSAFFAPIPLFILSSGLFAASSGAWGQAPESFIASRSLPAAAEIRSPDWKVRRKAFAKLIGANPESYAKWGLADITPVLRGTLNKAPKIADSRKMALIEMLETENGLVAEKERKQFAGGLLELPRKDRLSEEYTTYWADVIEAVTSLQDPRSLDALLGAMTTGNLVTDALVSLGKLAVGPLVNKVRDPDPTVRSSAIRILSNILERSFGVSSDLALKSRIKAACMHAAVDDNPIVRMSAVRALVQLGDRESIVLVEGIGKRDPYREASISSLLGRHLVREAASKALKSRRGKQEK